jgi:hypothetical protein
MIASHDILCYKKPSDQPNIIVAEPQVETDISEKLATAVSPEKQTVLHCRLKTSFFTYIRIHPTTYLIENTGNKCKLITTVDISVAPEWCAGNYESGYNFFTLIFEGLSNDCASFHLQEFAGPMETNLFETAVIERNKTDVYEAVIFCSE